MKIETILNSPCGKLNRHLETKPEKKNKIVKARNDCPEVQKMHWDLKYWCLEKGIEYQKEYKFSKKRKFRFDFAIKDHHIGIEYEGIFSKQSRHTNKIGYSKDTDKYRIAAVEGWTVLRYTQLNYLTLLDDLNKILSNFTTLNQHNEII